ncbi:MAG TPA: hypothetical protein VH025_01395 [Solirubrobacteraceae bacterium]|nr:hypothetical protein [Solirubrobacteraceae bacterium]
MQQYEQQLVDRPLFEEASDRDGSADWRPQAPARDAERAARRSLRAQIARLEHELSGIVAETFPHIRAVGESLPGAGPSLLDLEALERSRDRLAMRLAELRASATARAEHEREAHELLEAMRLEPGRYKFVRLPVADLGQGGCGVYEVRPRLGIIGMLAGWWQLTLSSGCPLVQGSRVSAAPMDVSPSLQGRA